MKAIVMSVMLLLATAAGAEDFNYAAYKSTDLALAFQSAYVITGTDYHIEGAEIKYKVEATFSGKHRLTDPKVQNFISKWVTAKGHPKEYESLFKHEILVLDKNKKGYWMPLQNSLVTQFGTEVEKDAEVDLYIMYLGAYSRNKVFSVNEFQPK
jgi:hypothetical protein